MVFQSISDSHGALLRKLQTIQGIAGAAVYHEEWPILVLTPSSARYHWESEFQQWLGAHSPVNKNDGGSQLELDSNLDDDQDLSPVDQSKCMRLLEDSEIHVLTASKEDVIPSKTTRVVVCSYGLAPALVDNGKIYPGLFKCAIVDESHMLKNMATKRTRSLVPVLRATNRCLLLSGTPALARPAELWPQLTILGTEQHGWWENEDEFISNYVKSTSTARRAELHTMLTGTVMIRRLKSDILKSLPKKVREKALVDVCTPELRKELHQCMVLLREGKGVLGKLARQHSAIAPIATHDGKNFDKTDPSLEGELNDDMKKAVQGLKEQCKLRYHEGKEKIHFTLETTATQLDEKEKQALIMKLDSELRAEVGVWYRERVLELRSSEVTNPDELTASTVLNRMYTLTAKAKLPLVVDMLKKWLDDPTKGKVCVFAHHLFVLDAIVEQVGLSKDPDSNKKYIRIDGSTSPRDRQEQIKCFQSDPSVRIAVLGITAAGVAVTLTAASTVWFTELFWTPALMIQAEGEAMHMLISGGLVMKSKLRHACAACQTAVIESDRIQGSNAYILLQSGLWMSSCGNYLNRNFRILVSLSKERRSRK